MKFSRWELARTVLYNIETVKCCRIHGYIKSHVFMDCEFLKRRRCMYNMCVYELRIEHILPRPLLKHVYVNKWIISFISIQCH